MSELAYLVIREGVKWSDVFRLVPGQSVTIGRAPTNQIVVKDERCSRTHVEVFMSGGRWLLRDLPDPDRATPPQHAGRRRIFTAKTLRRGGCRATAKRLVMLHTKREAVVSL